MRAASNSHKEEETARQRRFVDKISKFLWPPRVGTAHLNARQGLVGPDGVAPDHVDPVVVYGDSGLVLTCGGERPEVSSQAHPNTVKSAENLTTVWEINTHIIQTE